MLKAPKTNVDIPPPAARGSGGFCTCISEALLCRLQKLLLVWTATTDWNMHLKLVSVDEQTNIDSDYHAARAGKLKQIELDKFKNEQIN